MDTMWKAMAARGALIGALCLPAQEAAAQVGGLLPKVRVKLGVFLPQDGDTKDFAGTTHLRGEVEVGLPVPGAGRVSVAAGYSEGSKSGRKLRVIPITVSQTFSPPNPAAGITGNVYFGYGIGLYYLRASGGGDSDSKTSLGGFGMVGYQFPNDLFIEGKYHLTGKVGDVSASGISLMLGKNL